MKRILLSFIFLLPTILAAQSTNLDRERFSVSYVKLPSDPIIDHDKRTFSINLNGISIQGYSRVNAPGTLDIKYNFEGTTVSDISIEKIKHEKKNKDGKVISVSYTYKAKAKYTSRATINVINSFNGKSYEQNFQEKSYYTSNAYNSYYKAERHYAINKYDIKSNHRSKHKTGIKSSIKSYLNSRYGYIPFTTNREFLWILGSDRHPEHKKHHEAYNKVKTIFAKMKYDEPMDEIHKELEPVIQYFNDVIPRYPGKKRKMRKVKYASYYNLANIYYYLDMPEKVKENAQKLIENGYDKSDGKRFLRYADALIKDLETNQMKSRHMKVITEDLSNIEKEAEEVASPQPKQNLEFNKAYLITKKNDTVLVDIDTKNIDKIAYDVRTVQYDNNGSPIGTRIKKAKVCKELLFVDGLHYKNIKFKESSAKNGALSVSKALEGASDKLCKVLFESDKINLYKFNNKELVFVTPGSDKGKSTLSMAFVFGFKKNLMKLAKDCPEVAKKAKAKAYKNTEESLLKFCNDLTDCDTSKSIK
ncbi:hypothetical protein F7018_00210 [Tenacibaculum aiptasiae]|uniref:Tetratricopeptide repeat protein n=1 Tax=Tenacibaculum aiptasiae TaxID=426481 RepID=A0A7J5AS16_9FLAO|nr:hypothetical protein [Tenacibaculum aiptasiae]KAB1160334.1 hypothetical protein F7018_00210 [Tenacibaculum aiptasiae]